MTFSKMSYQGLRCTYFSYCMRHLLHHEFEFSILLHNMCRIYPLGLRMNTSPLYIYSYYLVNDLVKTHV